MTNFSEKYNAELVCLHTNLLAICSKSYSKSQLELVQKAYNFSLVSSETKLRTNGEPYILHHLRVAIIAEELIGLGCTAVLSAMLHDLVTDNLVSIESIENEFGKEVAGIVRGLIKISSVYTAKVSLQSENFITLLLTISDDVRVIILKLADRLDNIRHIKKFEASKQLSIANETRLLYAPIAHRLGLYHIKTELEDISLRHIDPESYFTIAKQLKDTKKAREEYIEKFSEPIKNALLEKNYEFEIKGRPKSVNSIYGKINKKEIDISEIFDLFAIRVILKNISKEKEKEMCWSVYSLVTNIYTPNPVRLRDWISTPRPSGYESLHTTVIGPDKQWVEVQIRTERMDEVAEKGDAAHWKYKESTKENNKDLWFRKIRDVLEAKDPEAIDELKQKPEEVANTEIFVFTPQGDIKKLREGATILDFAYSIHSKVGNTCTGAKVNDKIVPIKYKLTNGDTVEILTSKNQKPREEWLNIVASPRTKARIKKAINETLFKQAEIGKEMLERKMGQLKIEAADQFILKLLSHYKYKRALDFYQDIADNKIDLQTIKDVLAKTKLEAETKDTPITEPSAGEYAPGSISDTDYLVIDENLKNVDYKLAKCCRPIPGDRIFGFVTIERGIQIHRDNCPNAKDLFKRYAYRIVPAKWTDQSKDSAFLVEIVVTGIDKIGIINHINEVISKDRQVSMRSIAINTKDGMFQCFITVFVNSLHFLDSLLANINKIKGVHKAERVNKQIG